MRIAWMLRELAFEAGRGAVVAIVDWVRGKPAPSSAPGLSHRDVEHQQRQIRSATAHQGKGSNDGNE
jgi:hypothetical protein